MNQKKLIIEYYDSLTNQIDIYAEQVLEKYKAEDKIRDKMNSVYLPNKQVNNNYLIPHYQWTSCEETLYIDPYLEKFPLKQELTNVRFDPKTKKVHDYVNEMRQEMIDELKIGEHETLVKCQRMMKEKQSIDTNEIESKLFENKFSFVIIRKEPTGENLVPTRGLFQCFLVVLNFYINFAAQSYLK